MSFTLRHATFRVVVAVAIVIACFASLPWTLKVRAEVFEIPAGDVDALIEAIEEANEVKGEHEIHLAQGSTYVLMDRYEDTAYGLPMVEFGMKLVGNGATITRERDAPRFGIFHISGGYLTTIDSLTISNGDATGGIFCESPLKITNSTITGNFTGFSGGGIYGIPLCDLIVENSTISGNAAADSGGGIYIDQLASLTIKNSTISNNVAAGSAGGVYHAITGARFEMSNTIVAGNTGNNGPDDIQGELTDRQTYTRNANNLVGNGDGLEGISHGVDGNQIGTVDDPIDPMLGALGDNGGSTWTMALLPGSPAIDAGDDELATETDQRGIIRPQGSASDIGAFEYVPAVVDTTAPEITPVVTGTLGNNDWYVSNVTVAWTIEDAESSIDSTDGCDESIISDDTDGMTLTCTATSEGGTTSESVTIKRDATSPELAQTVTPNPVHQGTSAVASANATDMRSGIASQQCDPVDTSNLGLQSVYCTATDYAGNTASAPATYIVLDATGPLIEANVSGPTGTHGWYTGDVTVEWSVSDDSDITSTNGCDLTSITSDTTGVTLNCIATSEGGIASEWVTIKRDATLPVVTWNGNLGNYDLSDTIAITCSADDATSGIAVTTCMNISGPASMFGPGSHTFSASATDHAGNTASATVSFSIGVSHADVCAMTRQYISQPATAQSACTMLMTAQLARQSGNSAMAEISLLNYRLQIQSAAGRRYISTRHAAELIELSRSL